MSSLIFALGIGLTLTLRMAAADPPAIAAAADLKPVLIELASAFAAKTKALPRFTFGSSGQLAQQIANGAPFELFLSADEDYIFGLVKQGKARDAGVVYGRGRVVVFAPANARWQPDAALAGLRAALTAKVIRHFAIANPAHAPYGRAARAVLESVKLYAEIEPRLVLGENVAQAAQFALSGAADGAIIPLSLAIPAARSGAGAYAILPRDLHKTVPLRQRMALMNGATPTAIAFYAFLQTDASRAAFVRNGIEPAE
ncbi:MAG: molybdate ABC transporter substrate-binding protein [Gammaproteobacteria bacterium]|nr:molybdate ABC transporter substrate-binding protein [Gammaproteobacteria bacterium]